MHEHPNCWLDDMNIYTNLIINTKTGRGVSKSRKFHLRCISVPKKCLRHAMRHAIVSRFQIPMFTSERNAVRTVQQTLPDRLVIGDTSYSLFFKGLLFRSLHCKTGKSFDTLLSQWASFLHEKQDVTQVLNSCRTWTCPIAWSYIEANIHDYNWTEMFCERMLLLSAVLGILFVLQCPSTSGKRVKYLHSHSEYINFT